MKRPTKAILAMALFSPTLAWAACDVRSGPTTTPLVELYTSEGCSSCPPADQRLSQLASGAYASNQAVALSLHVDYWDDLGWKDRFAEPQFSDRQSWLVRANRHKTVFTPHFFVSGTEVRDWRTNLADELKRVSAEPARASIRLEAAPATTGTISLAGTATASNSKAPLALFVAVTEDNLTSNVSAGENRGVTLSHDRVVREWIGPIRLEDGHIEFKLTVATRPTWNTTRLGIAAFVEDLGTAEVLQAVGASQCLRS
jgi:hypothetical protein